MTDLLTRMRAHIQVPEGPQAEAGGRDQVQIHREVVNLRVPLVTGLLGGDLDAKALPPLLQVLLARKPLRSTRGALLFDVEATGLSRGTGTMVFLLGMIRINGGRLDLEQHFLEAPGAEEGLLRGFLGALDQAPMLLSYNGKSYDMAVLRNRLIINRLLPAEEAEPRTLPHLDLLHIGRALWKNLLPDHRLATLEQQLLGVQREPDELSGALMPAAWFSWLSRGDPSKLRAMLAHNRQDLLSCLLLAEMVLAQVLMPPNDRVLQSNLCSLFARKGAWGLAGAAALVGGDVGLGDDSATALTLQKALRRTGLARKRGRLSGN